MITRDVSKLIPHSIINPEFLSIQSNLHAIMKSAIWIVYIQAIKQFMNFLRVESNELLFVSL